MIDFLCPVLEFMILLPWMMIAYLPMKQHLRMRPVRLAAIITPFIILLALAGGGLCYLLSVKTTWPFFLAAAIAGVVYVRSLQIKKWKSISVFLAVCGVYSCLGSVARALNLILAPGSGSPWLSLRAALLYNLMCWLLTVMSWRPATPCGTGIVRR